MLKETFETLLLNYTNRKELIGNLWEEIEKNHSNKKRHYHTLSHLENLLTQLTPIKDKINDWHCISFTLYYHDIVYNALNSDNEEKSAELAEKRMKQLSMPAEMIEKCKAQILATKKHLDNSDTDTNYFTDADLSVLGQDWEIYAEYYQNVRKEYSVYPNLIYNPGRKKVLKHFLEMGRIYKTEYFYSKFEKQAKQNLQKELELL
ncbi:MAG: hypothetical protein K0R51_1473 [Cytophagaceae bacterium]|jgi:predicted metal-dependent HD superfamily phosphohydrolase|nr:hypothetical protein [Cytophagaceae bacterium]